MAVKRAIAGSVLATTLLGVLLFHGSVSGPAFSTEPDQGGKASSASAARNEATTKANPRSRPKAPLKATKENSRGAEGPWLASQKHFAGETWPGLPPCPSEIEAPQAVLDDGRVLVRWSSSKETAQRLRKQLWCIRDDVPVRALIAVVPDPVQTHLALFMDRIVEAIQLAAGSMDYVVDRYWLPWDIAPKTDWGDYDSFKEAKAEQKQKETQPGLLMFHLDSPAPPEGKPSVLYVFVVGEVPTAGVNGDQFATAVADVRLVEGISPDERWVPIHIMGPTLSGSLKSLHRLTKSLAGVESGKPKNVFTIYSGTVLASEEETRFAASWTFFHRFQNPTADALLALMGMLRASSHISCCAKPRFPAEACDPPKPCSPADPCIPEVAILSEADTIFGAAPSRAWAPWTEQKLCYDMFKYPREIANLRNAYTATAVQAPAPAKSSARRPPLSLNLTDPTNSSDEAPDFSKTQSPLSKEAILMGFAAEMQRNRYKYIGIIGSNELDVVFLISFLRNAVPDARIFLVDSDLLLQHEPDNVPYIGTFSVTTYPLLNRRLNQIHESGSTGNPIAERTRLPFSTRYEEGAYNATVCMVRRMLLEDSPDSNLGYLSERKNCWTEKTHVWLTVFGAGGPWPVEVFAPREEVSPAELEVPRPKVWPLPAAWSALSALLCVFAVIHVLILLGIAPFSPKFRDFVLGTFAPFRQLVGIHMASATLAGALALVALSTLKITALAERELREAWPWMIAAGLLFLALLATCWLLTFKYLRWCRADRTKEPGDRLLRNLVSPTTVAWQIAGFLVIWAGTAGLGVVWWTLLDEGQGHYGAFFAYRTVHLLSVVSPLMPMLPLLAAIYVAAIFYVWHLRFNNRLRPRLHPSWGKGTGQEDPNKSRLGLSSERLIAAAVNKDLRNGILGILILMVWLFVFDPLRFELFERLRFQRLYGLLFCLVVLLIVISGFRLDRIWRALRGFLLEVNRQRYREVFSELKPAGQTEDWPSIWFYGAEDPDWDYMLKSHEILQQLWGTPEMPAAAYAVDAAIGNIRTRRWQLQGKGSSVLRAVTVSADDGQLEGACSQAQDHLAETLNQALDSLQNVSSDSPPLGQALERHKLLERYVALRWVAFIRSVLARIRLLIIFLAASFSLALLSLVVYTFEPHRALLWSVTVLFVVIGVVTVNVLMQIHRDPILSTITGTTPNKLDPKFYVQIIALGAAPLLTLLATHFPNVSQSLVSFLQPGLEALK